ncbi:MAG: hypothetical protein SCK28_05575 [Bacillota bacterium]|nr:hypothetical protein [Bacillota bacterium]
MEPELIWIEIEETSDEIDQFNCNSDVIVKFNGGNRWIATFITYKNIEKLVRDNRVSGECMKGQFFWASNMLLVESIDRKSVEKVVQYLLTKKDFEKVFAKIETLGLCF